MKNAEIYIIIKNYKLRGVFEMIVTKIEGVNTLADLQSEDVRGVVAVAEGNYILQVAYEYDELSDQWHGIECDYVPYDASMGNVAVNEVFLK